MTRLWIGFAMVGLVIGAWGCGEDDSIVDPPDPVYSDAATPQEAVEDLEIAYRNRQIDPYAALLSAEFKFIFLESDAQGLPRDFLTHDEDSVATADLFEGQDLGGTGHDVTAIMIELTTLPPESATLDAFPGDEFQLVRVINTFLDVNLADKITLRVSGDQQLFYFRRGQPDLGEDPARWYLVQWEDLGSSFGKPRVGAPTVDSLTWGSIKLL